MNTSGIRRSRLAAVVLGVVIVVLVPAALIAGSVLSKDADVTESDQIVDVPIRSELAAKTIQHGPYDPRSLEEFVAISDLIVVGTVRRVTPAEFADQPEGLGPALERWANVHVAVEETLYEYPEREAGRKQNLLVRVLMWAIESDEDGEPREAIPIWPNSQPALEEGDRAVFVVRQRPGSDANQYVFPDHVGWAQLDDDDTFLPGADREDSWLIASGDLPTLRQDVQEAVQAIERGKVSSQIYLEFGETPKAYGANTWVQRVPRERSPGRHELVERQLPPDEAPRTSYTDE